MFFKRKSKNNQNSNNQNPKTSKNVEPNFDNFDYEAIKFNEFLTDDAEYIKSKNAKDLIGNNYQEVDTSDIDNSPLGQRLAKDNKVMEMINNTVKNNLNLTDINSIQKNMDYSETPLRNNVSVEKDVTIQSNVPIENNVSVQKQVEENYTITDNTKSFLKNQNTKVLLPDDIEGMITNINQIVQEASTILNDTSYKTKQLSINDEIKTPQTKEFSNLNQSINHTVPNTTLNSNVFNPSSNIVPEQNANMRTTSLKTKALFNDAETYTDYNNLDNLKPLEKEKTALRITKLNKRDI